MTDDTPIASKRPGKGFRKESMAVSLRRVLRIQFPIFYPLLQSNLACFLLLPAVDFCCLFGLSLFFYLCPVKYFQ